MHRLFEAAPCCGRKDPGSTGFGIQLVLSGVVPVEVLFLPTTSSALELDDVAALPLVLVPLVPLAALFPFFPPPFLLFINDDEKAPPPPPPDEAEATTTYDTRKCP